MYAQIADLGVARILKTKCIAQISLDNVPIPKNKLLVSFKNKAGVFSVQISSHEDNFF